MTKVRDKTIKAFPETTFCFAVNEILSRSEDEMLCPKCYVLIICYVLSLL